MQRDTIGLVGNTSDVTAEIRNPVASENRKYERDARRIRCHMADSNGNTVGRQDNRADISKTGHPLLRKGGGA
jgi:hypothetical protein